VVAVSDVFKCCVACRCYRWFLDRVATHILAFEDDGTVTYFEGNFQEYQKDLLARKGLIEPKRPVFRPLPKL
jgi:hypothetical protein